MLADPYVSSLFSDPYENRTHLSSRPTLRVGARPGVLPIDERAVLFLQVLSSSTGGSRTRKHEGLSFAAVPIRVPCQKELCLCWFACVEVDDDAWRRSTSTAAVFQPTLTVHPLNHGRGVVERLFSAIGQSNRELFVGFHRPYSK